MSSNLNLDEGVIQDLKEVKESIYNDLELNNLSNSTIDDLDTILSSRCSLATKSIFALYSLISKIPNGEVRPQQVVLTYRISNAIEAGDNGLMQAGTGVGKSISYLIPAIISRRKCIVSTSTIQLTSQLTDKDLPLLEKYLFPDLKYIGLQSLSNYICPKKFEKALEEYKEDSSRFKKVRGDEVEPMLEILPHYTNYKADKIKPEDFTIESTGCKENCDGFRCAGSGCTRNCKFEGKENCPVFRIVGKVYKSNVVVTNHAYMSRMVVDASKEKDKEFGILAKRYLWICDEAHDLEGYLERAFSSELSKQTLKNDYAQKLQNYKDGDVMKSTFESCFEEYRQAMLNSSEIKEDSFYKSANELIIDIGKIIDIIANILGVMRNIENQAVSVLNRLNEGKTDYLIKSDEQEFEFDDVDTNIIKENINKLLTIKVRLETLSSYDVKFVPTTIKIVNEILESLKVFYLAYSKKDAYITYYNIAWSNDGDYLFKISATYLKTGDALQAGLGRLDAEKTDLEIINTNKINMIGVSATLCVDNSFRDMGDKLGMLKLKDIKCHCADVGTVFDYRRQGLMYIPQNIPDVKNNRKEHFDYFKASIKPLIEATNGGALILCTTIEETRSTYKYLSYEFKGKYNVLSADDPRWKSKNDLVKAFREDVNSILVGTRGFFQGLDVQGDSLRLLCLNKLPFGTQGVVAKRKNEIATQKGLDAFRVNAIVPTTMMLLQAVGRLIRHTSDKGVIAIYDNRLYNNLYWMTPIINSIPKFTNTKDIEDIKAFLQKQ